MSSGSRKGKERARMADMPAASILSPLMDQLLAGGFMSKPLDATGIDPQEAAKLEQCLSTMLARMNSAQQDLSRLMDKYRVLAGDFDRMEQGQTKNRQTLENSEHEKEQARAKATAAIKELTSEQTKHAQARDEIQKARLALASVKSVAQHESKRRENEVASVMARWQRISSSSTLVQQAAITLNTPDTISRINRGTQSNGRETPSGITLLEESLRRADDEKHTMQEENIHLREVIGDVLNEVKATLSALNVEMPSLQGDVQDSLIHITSLHLVLSPNEMMDHLSKLLITLREAALHSIQASEEDASRAHEHARRGAMSKISELEESLSQMQAELDAARLEAKDANELLEALQRTKRQIEAKAKEEAGSAQRHIRQIRTELEEANKLYRELGIRYEREKIARIEAMSGLERAQDEMKHLRKRSADSDTSIEVCTSKRRKGVTQPDAETIAYSAKSQDCKETAVTEKRHRRPVRQSTTSNALKNILASAADTPPNRTVPLSSKQANMQRESSVSAPDKMQNFGDIVHKVNSSTESNSVMVPSSEATAAKDRIQRAVEAAKARKGSNSRLNNITQRRK